jgi:hypothetical protein
MLAKLSVRKSVCTVLAVASSSASVNPLFLLNKKPQQVRLLRLFAYLTYPHLCDFDCFAAA